MGSETQSVDEMASPDTTAISDAAVSDLRARVGVERRLASQFHNEATLDAIRHFAGGSGDLNPLWLDQEYAEASRYGGIVAPPCFLSSCGMPRSVGLPGIHALYTGSSWTFERPVALGQRVETSVTLAELEEKQGRYGGRQFLEVDEAIYRSEDGDILARLRSHCMRIERSSARSRNKYADLAQHSYTPEQIEEIDAGVRAEVIRGAEPRYWEDTAVGEHLQAVVKGPLTVTDMIGWLQGWGGMFIRPHATGVEWRKRHPKAYTLDRLGIFDVPERVHWDSEFARAAGAPAAFDYGPQRIAWLGHLMTNWIGDDGWLSELDVQVRRMNLVGDTTWCRGEIVERELRDGRGVARCAVEGVNQRGETTMSGHAVAELPRRPRGYERR